MIAELVKRSGNKCELCESVDDIKPFLIDENSNDEIANTVAICSKCLEQIVKEADLDVHHLRCLNDSMWSEHKPVQILVYRLLSKLSGEVWASDLKSQMYLEPEEITLAISGLEDPGDSSSVVHLDSNGAVLTDGDSVTLIKDLVVKGANFTAKRGTMVRNIALTDNPEHIEGRVNGTRIVLVTKFLKKVNE